MKAIELSILSSVPKGWLLFLEQIIITNTHYIILVSLLLYAARLQLGSGRAMRRFRFPPCRFTARAKKLHKRVTKYHVNRPTVRYRNDWSCFLPLPQGRLGIAIKSRYDLCYGASASLYPTLSQLVQAGSCKCTTRAYIRLCANLFQRGNTG